MLSTQDTLTEEAHPATWQPPSLSQASGLGWLKPLSRIVLLAPGFYLALCLAVTRMELQIRQFVVPEIVHAMAPAVVVAFSAIAFLLLARQRRMLVDRITRIGPQKLRSNGGLESYMRSALAGLVIAEAVSPIAFGMFIFGWEVSEVWVLFVVSTAGILMLTPRSAELYTVTASLQGSPYSANHLRAGPPAFRR